MFVLKLSEVLMYRKVLMTVVLVLLLAACGGSPAPAKRTPPPTIIFVLTVPPTRTPRLTSTALPESPQAGALCAETLARPAEPGIFDCMALLGADHDVCAAQQAQAKAGPLLFVIQNNPSGSEAGKWILYQDAQFTVKTSQDLAAAAAVVCIEASLEKVGCYKDGGMAGDCLPTHPGAYRRKWHVFLVKNPEGWVVENVEFSGGPPPEKLVLSGSSPVEMNRRGVGSEPVEALLQWLGSLK